MEQTYSPQELGKLIGRTTNTLQKWDRKGILKAHRDRLVRFGYEYFEMFCQRHHTEIVVINGDSLSPEEELVRELIAIVTVFSATLHGMRSYRKVVKDSGFRTRKRICIARTCLASR